jgi:hypothetical protein
METERNLEEPSLPARPRERRKYPWAMLVVAGLFIIAAYFSWRGSWFGRQLSDDDMQQYLHDTEKPRNVQHALSQISDRMAMGDGSVRKWYPDVISASQHQLPEVRSMAAWVMGQDNKNPDFHAALTPMLGDWHPGVRHNAALALVRFKDRAARPELIAMLKPTILRAEVGGTVELIIKEDGIAVGRNAPLARIKQSDGQIIEARAPEEGRIDFVSVRDGATVEAGSELMTLSPSGDQVWESLRALYCIGQLEDIPFIERYTRMIPGMPDKVQKQAASTIEAIRNGGERCS